MIRTRLAAFTAAALALAALPAFAQNAPAVTPAGDTTVTVQSTGSGPKRPLRYKVPAGTKERFDMKMDMSVSVDIPGMGAQTVDTPPIVMSLDIDVTNVAPNGDISVAVAIANASMEGPGMPPGTLDVLKGLAAAMTMDARGIVKNMKFDESKITDPMMKQMISSSGLDRLSAPLPEEPVGVGAKWQVTQALAANGIKMDQITNFELVAMDDTSATLAMTVSQSAPPQTIAPPGMPAGMEMSLAGMTGSGTGKMTLIDGALALLGDLTIKSNITMDVNAQGQNQRMSTATEMKMTVSKGQRQ